MYRSMDRLYVCLMRNAYRKGWFSSYVRSRRGIVSATRKGNDSGCPISSVKYNEVGLSLGMILSHSSGWMQKSFSTFPADIAKSSAVGSSTNMVESSDDKVENGTDAKPRLSPQEPKNPVSWLSLCLMFITGGGLVYYYQLERERRIKAAQEVNPKGSEGGKGVIGGPFKLINHEGKEVTSEQFKGSWTLLYFGFTHCPDICPSELQKMVDAIDIIEKRNNLHITPVFITVDPERDSVEQIREYVTEFHPRLIGLTGSLEGIRQVARDYRVYYAKAGEEDSDYLIDHSIIMYLMNPQMEFVKHFGKNYDVSSLADGIVAEIKGHKP
ncbi:hypothetical protein KP509_29G067200 [Ceratopteris richardii]|uniref:Thioredoxin domain-containing protein n=1 Tax=Ceratopteris richardii TaxID=49495 RepID=A0A8T2R7U2_CERRI|nr:hypothetical protein KP509_29G067200 [Ceratopteris richardii]